MLEKRRIGPEIRRLNNLIKREVDSSSVKNQLDRLTGLHSWVIGHIARQTEPVFQRDLEKRFSVRRSTMSNIITLMEKNGLIIRQPYNGDARLKQIVLTDRAKELDKTAQKDMRRIDRLLTDGISTDELTAFFATIDKIKANLEKEEKYD